MPNFWHSHYSNSQNSIISFDYSWFLAKNISNFVLLSWKLNNWYCHSIQGQLYWFVTHGAPIGKRWYPTSLRHLKTAVMSVPGNWLAWPHLRFAVMPTDFCFKVLCSQIIFWLDLGWLANESTKNITS